MKGLVQKLYIQGVLLFSSLPVLRVRSYSRIRRSTGRSVGRHNYSGKSLDISMIWVFIVIAIVIVIVTMLGIVYVISKSAGRNTIYVKRKKEKKSNDNGGNENYL